MMISKELQEFAERYTAAWCSHDGARVAECYTSTGSLQVNDGAPAVGRAAIAGVASQFITELPDLVVLMDGVSEESDGVHYRWTLLGINGGPGGTGATLRINGYEVWKFGEDGLIAASHGHFDADEYQRQLSAGSHKK
jgi:hypothetical protein